jgi:Family of unknown function (DUF6406)
LLPSAFPGFDDDAQCGVVAMNASPPRMVLFVASPAGEAKHELFLGDTFLVGGNTWRFEDVVFANPDAWTATLRYVPPGAPPFRPPAAPRDYVQVELRSFGTVDEAGISRLEQDLGRRLPPMFRMWLAHNNGAAPVEGVWIPGTHVSLDPFLPILGVHPDNFSYDIRHGQQRAGQWLTSDFTVIAIGVTGVFVVGNTPANADNIYVLRDADALQLGRQYAARGYATPAEYLCAEHLKWVAPGIGSFCAYLRPTPPLPPATLRHP